MKGTKLEIFEVAVNLFANRGFDSVGVRDIASVVGIKSSSIYNHFENKDDILDKIYEYFDENYYLGQVTTEEILKNVAELSHNELLDKLSPSSPSEDYKTLRKILLIALDQYNKDDRAKNMLEKLLEETIERYSVVLNKMIELEIIEPMDVELFTTILVSYSISATVSRYNGMRLMPYEEWQEGRRMLFGLVRKR